MSVKEFIDHNYRHFNARAVKQAAQGYLELLERGGTMFVTLAGAMSTAELGLTLAQMIRMGYVGAISCTGANLEEDIFNAVAHSKYRKLDSYRDLTPSDEVDLLNQGMNRVTDTCIPEDEAMRKVERYISAAWKSASDTGTPRLAHEFIYDILRDEDFLSEFEIDRENSWVLAACQQNIPLFVPGWEDSTLGNFFVSQTIKSNVDINSVKSGLHYMRSLIDWYCDVTTQREIGFFQVGGGIAGDFPICVVPLLHQDLSSNSPLWAYFCQITDAQESYGGYSGALPNEKITWGKVATTTPRFVIHSDATIVAPLIFQYVLEGASANEKNEETN